jgi:nucleotide-binding universal stress UspA family protein
MRILLAYDGSAGAETACRLVAQLRLPRGTELAVVGVVDPRTTAWSVVDVPMNRRDKEAEGRKVEGVKQLDAELSNIARGLRAPDRTCETRILRGRAATVLVDEAERWKADLIVVGNRGHGVLEGLLLGSTSAEVVDHAPCPVLVARHPSVHRLVIGMDGSEGAERAVATLLAWPLLRAAPASVVGVVESLSAWDFAAGAAAPQAVEMAMEAQDERARKLATQVDGAVAALRRAGSLADSEIRKGDATDQLIRAATERGADLVVVGTRGLGMIRRLLLGSVARKVVLHASASVLIVRPPRERVEVRQSAGALAVV